MVNPLLPSHASSVAVNVLSQIESGNIPPNPDPSTSKPELPTQASATAVSVLSQLENGTIPPVPPKPLKKI